MYIYINGDYLPENEVKISPFDHGFLYGLGVFETFRIYDGHPFLLDDHFQRLAKGAKELNIELKLEKQDVEVALLNLLTLNNLKDAYVRLNISAGEAPIGLQTEAYTNPNVIIFIKPISSSLPKTKKATFLKIARNSPEGKERLKSHHYLNNILGKREISDLNQEGIFLSDKGHVAEGIVSNIFWAKDGQVFTPSLNTGILNGITRQFVLKMLKRNNITFQEGFYFPSDVIEADEVFITNSIQEIVLITSLNEHEYKGEPKITCFLQDLYKSYVTNLLSSSKM